MKQLPVIYSQRDPRWAGQRLGTVNGVNLGGYGCYITCFSMLATYYGHTVTPGQLDDLFTNNQWYISGNLLTDNGLQKAYPDIQFVSSYDYSNNPADLKKLQTLLQDSSTMVILEVDFNPEQAGLQTHFVVAIDCDGTNVQIADAWTGETCSVSVYGDPKTTIQKYVVYKGTPAQTAITTELDRARTDRDTNYNLASAIFQAIGVELDPNDKEDSKKKGVQAINDLKQKLETEQQENHDLNDTIIKLTETKKDYGQQVMDAQQAQKTNQDNLNQIFKLLGVTKTQDAVSAIQSLQRPHEEVVKQVQPTLDALAEAAIVKKPVAQKKTHNSIALFFRWFNL